MKRKLITVIDSTDDKSTSEKISKEDQERSKSKGVDTSEKKQWLVPAIVTTSILYIINKFLK